MRPAESQHWYYTDGSPIYTVVGSNGVERNTTLRDARKLSLVPSVTSIIRCAASPGLEHWKQEQVLLAALTLPRRPHETEKSWLARVWHDSREQASKAAERGTQIHAAVQGHFEGEQLQDEYAPYVQCAVEELEAHFPGARWVAEKAFAHPLGYGGKIDLHCDVAVVDIKTKEFAGDEVPGVYEEHAMQLAAYRRGLGLEHARCGNLFVSVSNPGVAHLHLHDEDELRRGMEMFDALLSYWRARSKYDPSMGFQTRTAA